MKLLCVWLSAMALAGCASDIIPRETTGAHSEAYTEHPVSATRYVVEYRVEGKNYRRAYNLALRRAAQIALEEGYPSFEIVSGRPDANGRTRTVSIFPTEQNVPPQRDCGLIGCPKPARPMEAPDSKGDQRRASGMVSLEVQLTRDGPDGSASRYDAAEVVNGTVSRARG